MHLKKTGKTIHRRPARVYYPQDFIVKKTLRFRSLAESRRRQKKLETGRDIIRKTELQNFAKFFTLAFMSHFLM